MINTQDTAIIRNRGQLTIPGKLRGVLNWMGKDSVVSIKAVTDREIVIRPYEKEKEIDWDRIWKNLRKIRSVKGGNKMPLSRFIAEDRYRH